MAESTIQRTPKNWKIEIPKSQKFTKGAKVALEKIFQGNPLEQRLRKLQFDIELMRLLKKGRRIFLETHQWHNKSYGRGPFKLIAQTEDGSDIIEKKWHLWYPGNNLESLLDFFFFLAKIIIDDVFY